MLHLFASPFMPFPGFVMEHHTFQAVTNRCPMMWAARHRLHHLVLFPRDESQSSIKTCCSWKFLMMADIIKMIHEDTAKELPGHVVMIVTTRSQKSALQHTTNECMDNSKRAAVPRNTAMQVCRPVVSHARNLWRKVR